MPLRNGDGGDIDMYSSSGPYNFFFQFDSVHCILFQLEIKLHNIIFIKYHYQYDGYMVHKQYDIFSAITHLEYINWDAWCYLICAVTY